MNRVLSDPKAAVFGTFTVLLITVVAWFAHQSVLAQAPAESSPRPETTEATGGSKASASKVWTCSMHPQVRTSKSGACPICGMKLTAQDKANSRGPLESMSLQEMLAIAMEHNPEVRAADARLRTVEAELDRTRLEVVQNLIAYRERWQAQRFAVRAAEQELAEAEKQEKHAKDGVVAPQVVKMLESARQTLAFQKGKLAEIEVELPFLIGQAPQKSARPGDDACRKMIREKLLPRARQIVELRTREYQTGTTNILQVTASHRQLLELEIRLAETTKQKIAAIESQRQLMKNSRAITDQLYKAGKAAQGDVLTIDLELSKLDLWLLELREH